MRFLLGLIIGAAMTLGIAATLEGHTNELVSEARELWGELQRNIDAPINARQSITREPSADASTFIAEEPRVEVPPVLAAEPEPALQPAPEIVNLEPLDANATQPGTESVWTPFHSERSANGFAEVLIRETGHPFSIDRRGPGEYQVIFAYANENEKSELLGLIASVTGSR